jgi:hypothetical protein
VIYTSNGWTTYRAYLT